MPGEHALTGSERLFSRPTDELVEVLSRLGVHAEVNSRRLTLRSQGWVLPPGGLVVDSRRSSQFASGVLLNCWELEAPLRLTLRGPMVSAGYWELTCRMLGDLGMRWERSGDEYRIAAGQAVGRRQYAVEPDMGCAFAVAAVAAVSGDATLEGFPVRSLQPDARFVEILGEMGVPVERDRGLLRVRQARRLGGVRMDLRDSPDLFPVLAVLCALADGESLLGGAPQLRYKESDRIRTVTELVAAMGRDVEARADGIQILPGRTRRGPFVFDADQDHRMAMAAAVARQAGLSVDLRGAEAVGKSFPEFWDILEWRP